LERVRRRAREERDEVRRAESRAAAQIERAVSYFPTVASAGDAPTRRELIEGGHVLPPGKLSSEEAETYLDAYSREHGRHFSAMDRLSLLSMLTQGERPPDMRKLEELYEEPGWVKATNEFTGLADAGRALDSFADGNVLGGLGSLAMAAPVGPGKLAKLGKLDDVARGGDDAARTARRGDPRAPDRHSRTGARRPDGPGVVIGRGNLEDRGALRHGEQRIDLPWQRDPKLDWNQNYGQLRDAMRQGYPIRDNDPLDFDGPFLNAERYVLQSRGWRFDPDTGYWYPPG
jgi:hypothetical protein